MITVFKDDSPLLADDRHGYAESTAAAVIPLYHSVNYISSFLSKKYFLIKLEDNYSAFIAISGDM